MFAWEAKEEAKKALEGMIITAQAISGVEVGSGECECTKTRWPDPAGREG